MFDLNTALVISLSVLAFISVICACVLIPLAIQFSNTMSSVKSFLDMVDDEVRPAVKEVKESIFGVKSLVKQGSKLMQNSIIETKTLVTASVHGVICGVKDYFSACKSDESSYNGNGSCKF